MQQNKHCFNPIWFKLKQQVTAWAAPGPVHDPPPVLLPHNFGTGPANQRRAPGQGLITG